MYRNSIDCGHERDKSVTDFRNIKLEAGTEIENKIRNHFQNAILLSFGLKHLNLDFKTSI